MLQRSLSKVYEPQKSEAKWYQYWLDGGYFTAEDKSSRKPFSIVIPPPNVTGMLHMGHALNNVLQDIVTRYKRMQGCNALWLPGMDHAGIATQNVVEQELAREGTTRHNLGREKFIERVWEWKSRYGGVIINQLKRLGCSCDWSRERFTMDEGLSRAVREAFVRLYNDGLIYQGDYIVNWCPRCHTAISDLEVEYRQEEGYLWYIRYPFADGKGEVVVATTRPETMLGDTAVAVNPHDKRHKNEIGKYAVLPLVNRNIPIIADDYVTMEFGSGAVKITPACDPNDFAMAERHDLEILKIMDGDAVINENGGPYAGQDRYECRRNVVADLEKQGYIVRKEPYMHNVGQCYRCRTDIEPSVSRQWFVKIKPLAKAAMAAVSKKKIRIVPALWENTYFEWMNNIRDWCISRQIWWGHRIPVWYCDHCGKMIVAAKTPENCPDCAGTGLKQEEDVLDTWFSSALWPFSTLGWPDKTKALKTFYPTSLLITGFDILFFWVARMMMMGLYLMKDVPFRDIYLHALVRDEKGEKMSKSKGNIIDPLKMMDKYGTDAFRFTLAAFTVQGRDVRMSEDKVEGYKFFVNKIWNASKFSLMNLEDYEESGAVFGQEDESLADRWIRARLNKVTAEMISALDEYRFNDAAMSIYHFIWHEFCDWYLELIKPLLYGKVGNARSRLAAQRTLFSVLKSSLKLLHPFMPFLTEELWQTFVSDGTSIMVSEFPVAEADRGDAQAEQTMAAIMEIITGIRNIRGEVGVAPAKKLNVIVYAPDAEAASAVAEGNDYIISLANLNDLTTVNEEAEPKGAATAIVGALRVYVLLDGVVDIAGEKARLEKEKAKLDQDLAVVSKKLSNRDFLAKAAEAIIKKEETKYKELREKHAALEAALRKFAEMRTL
ncbi:MAG: valine--tRNA ligase [Deltaproteobacteria bacterium]|nr:valine--tRNA ligase [Deltaproteobacteria bacterium]